VEAAGLFLRIMAGVKSAAMRREYRRRFWQFLRVRRRAGLALLYLFHIAMHHHAHTLAREMAAGESKLVNTF
jgi:hypothetical protein